MMTQQINQDKNRIDKSYIGEKIDELSKSVNNVYKYELLTTNQYLQQMELVLEIFNELSDVLDN